MEDINNGVTIQNNGNSSIQNRTTSWNNNHGVDNSEVILSEKEKKEPVLVSYIKDRTLNKNKNFVMIFVGPTGSGKSLAALRTAEMIDPTFTIDRVSFKAKDFMNIVNKLVADSEKGIEIKGKVIVWDETGVENNARQFMTISNRVMNYFFQTSRHLNLIVLMTVPLLSFLDSSTRKLSHCVAEMTGLNSQDKTTSAKVKMMQVNTITGQEYPKYLRYRRNGKMFKATKLRFSLPSKSLLDAYEKNKKAFTTQLNKEIMTKLLNSEAKDNKSLDGTKPLTPFQEQILECLRNGITKQKDIAEKLGRHPERVSENIAYMRKKGYMIGKYGNLHENTYTPTATPIQLHSLDTVGEEEEL